MNVLDSIKAHLPQNFYSELSTIFHELSVRHDEWTSLRKALCILLGRGKGSYDLFHPSLQQPSETIETNTVRVLEALHLVSTQLQQQNPYACQELLKLIKEIEPQSAISGKEVEMECTTPLDMAFLQELDKSAENILESTGLAIDSSSGLHRDISDLLFPQDLRLREVEGILDFSRPVSIKLPENAQNMT